MSRDIAAVKRYAKALYEVAREQNLIAKVEEDLRVVSSTIRGSVELQTLLDHPGISADKKKSVIGALFDGRVEVAVFNTLLLLLERRREAILPVLAEHYTNISNKEQGRADAIVTTPIPLTPAEMERVAERFGKLTGKTIRVTGNIDTKLLGGMQVKIGDRLYDGSLSGKLARLQKTLIGSQA
ncbi:MAG: F0F1 ATP synthase subunit delta [Gorillibacterium sp.]|nr:F0F1 ATP synthase subunit delta [Gorillibacterium sp.]